MNGDEDLGQDIIMKGEKFHYVGQDAKLVQIQGDSDPTPEKVVVMEPIPNQALSNGAAGEGLEAFPNAPRTAFYAQYDRANQLWRNNMVQTTDGDLPYTQQIAGPDVGSPIGKSVHDASVDGMDAQPMDRKPNGTWAQVSEPGDGYGQDGPSTDNHNANLGEDRRDKWVYEFSRENVPPFATHAQAHMQRSTKDIGEGNMDESVHTFASEDTNVLPLPRRRRQEPYANNGSGEKSHSLMERAHHHHHHHKDIGEGNMDEEVHGVASADTNVLPVYRRRVDEAYAPNGSHEKAHSLSQHHHHHHRNKKDIGEGNIDEEVHGVASADTHVLPMPRRRRQTPYANNGSGEKSHSLYERAHSHHHHNKDIGEGNIDEEVHGVASADTHVLPMPRRRRQTAYANNGSGEKAHSLAEEERNKKDIGEGNIDEEVHGVASADTHVLPMPRRRRQTPYANNGSGEKSHSLAEEERNKKDIGEGNIDEEVHGVASADTHVLPIPRRRRQTPYANNGSGEKAHSLAELEKGDIANKQVRSDVYTTVDNMIG